MDGDSITEARTAAASAVATKLLIKNDVLESGSIVAILGSGVQAKAHARVLNHSIKPKEVRVFVFVIGLLAGN